MEIFEFAMAQLFDFNMQKSGLVDTMWNFIVYTLSVLTAAITGYFISRSQVSQACFVHGLTV